MADGLTSNVNGDWSGLGVFNDVLQAEFCPDTSGTTREEKDDG